MADPDTSDEVLTLLTRLADLRSDKERIENEMIGISLQLARIMDAPVLFGTGDGPVMRATVVRPDPRPVISLHALEEYPELYQDCTKPVLDSAAFIRAIKAGRVTKDIADRVVSEWREQRPYVSFRGLTEGEPDAAPQP